MERVHRKRFTAPVQVIDPDQGAWYGGLYLAARGQESPELAGAMARVERFLADLEQSLERGDLELARCQSGQLRRGLAGLRDQARARGVRLRLRGLPTGEAVAEAHRLRAAGESMRALHREARERQARVGRRLEELRTHFSPKAVKGLVRSALSWRRLVEPHPLEGLAGYSDLAARTALPGHLLGWCEEAARDGSPGAGPGQAIRRLERFERCLDRYAAGIAAARREAFARLRSRGAGEAARIHAALQAALRGRGK